MKKDLNIIFFALFILTFIGCTSTNEVPAPAGPSADITKRPKWINKIPEGNEKLYFVGKTSMMMKKK